MKAEPLHFWSASTAHTWHRCERLVYYNAVCEGHGIEGDWAQDDLAYGGILHEALEVLARGESLSWQDLALMRSELQALLLKDPLWEKNQLDANRLTKANEWGRMLVGQVRGIERVVMPFLRARYKTVQAEAEGMRLAADGRSALLAKPDWLLMEPTEADWAEQAQLDPPPYPGLGYLEWKSRASVDADGRWQLEYVRNPQSWTGAITQLQQGRKIDWFMPCILVKGTETYHEELGITIRSNPLMWAWRFNPALGPKKATKEGPEFTDGCVEGGDGRRWRWEGTTRKGWERISTDEFPGGVEGWVAALPDAALAKLFILGEPIDIDWPLAEEWLQNHEETLVAKLKVAGQLRHDPRAQRELFRRTGLGGCFGGIGRSQCWAIDACLGDAGDDPLGSGRYRIRKPHHPLEVAALEKQS